VEFFILKRRLLENVTYPQSRIQIFSPANTSPEVNKALGKFRMFINECFTEDGAYITDEKAYPKVPGKAYKNCRYCVHKKVRCFPTKEDIAACGD
jgi:hypothetical protein